MALQVFEKEWNLGTIGSSVDLMLSLLSLWESQWQSQNWKLHVTLMVSLMLFRSRSDRTAVPLAHSSILRCPCQGWAHNTEAQTGSREVTIAPGTCCRTALLGYKSTPANGTQVWWRGAAALLCTHHGTVLIDAHYLDACREGALRLDSGHS